MSFSFLLIQVVFKYFRDNLALGNTCMRTSILFGCDFMIDFVFLWSNVDGRDGNDIFLKSFGFSIKGCSTSYCLLESLGKIRGRICFFDETGFCALAFSRDITTNRNIRIIIDDFFAKYILLKLFYVLIYVLFNSNFFSG